jgi:hypothetical protein
MSMHSDLIRSRWGQSHSSKAAAFPILPTIQIDVQSTPPE